MKKLLITGISGALGQLLTHRLRRELTVCGVDASPWKAAPSGVKAHGANALKREFEEVIRSELPDAVVHLGFIRHFHGDPRKRHDVNVRGTKRLLDLCVRYGVRKLVVVSSSTVYGAFPENPYHLDEDAPLSASRSYPEIRDLVEVDALASGFLWRHPEISSCVLRPVNVLGPEVQSMASRYLRQPRVPTVMGFDPMMQFIHQDDLIEAIVCALEPELRGVFNVIGSGEVPVHTAIAESGGTAWPIPEPLIRSAFSAFFRWGIGAYPVGMLDYLKYPVTLAGKRFAEETGYRALCGLRETFQSVRR